MVKYIFTYLNFPRWVTCIQVPIFDKQSDIITFVSVPIFLQISIFQMGG